jgi:hypothetical protein
MAERVTTIWRAEVIETPIKKFDWDDNGYIAFKESLGTLQGPLDDSVLHYRVTFDATLASIRPRKRRTMQGRA